MGTTKEPMGVNSHGPFKGHMWLILVDALTKWPEIIQISTTSSKRTIEVLRSLFARYGIPHTYHSI